jgi:endonuclease YncB( thermonuclease family)
MRVAIALVVLLTGGAPGIASLAHPGGVDEQGCHASKKSGESHCHPERLRAKQLSTCDLKRAPRAGEEGVFHGPLIRIRDGDTFEVKVQGVVMPFRLAEVDAPESDQPWGKESRNELAALIAGKELVLAPFDTDRYGRTVAFAWVGETCVNEEMVNRGAAWFYSQYSSSDFLFHVEENARNDRRGLWALPLKDRIEPWVWRHDKRS